MKTRLLLALFGLAIGFPAAALAQEQNAVTPRVREGIEDVLKKFEEAYNRHDAAAVAELFTEDGLKLGYMAGKSRWRYIFRSPSPREKV
jgi:hypothetical protein